MRRLLPVVVAFALGAASSAWAQSSRWVWWGTSQTTSIPVSASNPLPVQCN